MDQFLRIDDQVIPFAGKCDLKQHIPNKSNAHELKNFVVARSSRLVNDFTIYQGKTTFPPDLQNNGLRTVAVFHLSKEVKEGSYLCFDRYFTSIRQLE